MGDSSADPQKPRKRKWDVAEPSAASGEAAAPAPPPPYGTAPPPLPADAPFPPSYPPPGMPGYGSHYEAAGVPNPASIAALAASRLNAMLAAKGTPAGVVGTPAPPPPPKDEGVVAEVEINSCPPAIRYLLTKGVTHQEINQQTGATVIVRGRFRPPHEADLPVTSAAERPLYLLVSANSQSELDAAVAKINTMMKGESPLHRPSREESTTKVFVGIDLAEARRMNFNYVGKIIGPKGAYVKHIEAQSRARVQLKGRRSDNPSEQAEDDEEMHLLIIAGNKQAMETAKKLSEDLLGTVREDFEEHKKSFAARASGPYGGGGYPPRGPYPPPMAPGMSPYGAPAPYGGYPGYGGYGAPAPYGAYPPAGAPGMAYGAYPPGAAPPPGPPGAASPYGGGAPPGAPPGAEAYAAYGQPYAGYGYGAYAGYAPAQQPTAPSGPPGASTEAAAADQESASGPPGADSGSTSPRASRRFQEYPVAKKPRPDDDTDDNDAELGPRRPTMEEYSTSRYALPEATPEPYMHPPAVPKYEPYVSSAAATTHRSSTLSSSSSSSSSSGLVDYGDDGSASYASSSAAATSGSSSNGQTASTTSGGAKPGLPFWAAAPYSQSPLAGVGAGTADHGAGQQQQGGTSSDDSSYNELMRELGMGGRHS